MTTPRQQADTILYNAYVYTVDEKNSIQEAIAIKDGLILALGTSTEIMQYADDHTRIMDMQGKMLMPGLVDCHLHAYWGGSQLLSCSLDYQSLSIKDTLAIIQKHIDDDTADNHQNWLTVRAWSRSGMLPAGADITRKDLDSLTTQRPVILFANDCHTLVANSCALTRLGIDESVSDPSDGKYYRNEDGTLNGIIDDAPGMRAFDTATRLNHEESVNLARLIQKALNEQGITTVMDARVYPEHLNSFAQLSKQGQLSLRFLGAREITPADAPTPQAAQEAVQNVKTWAQQYHTEAWQPKPGVGVCSIKLFVDGVLQAPMHTAYLLKPYLIHKGMHYGNKGDLYFPEPVLDALILACAVVEINPHLHTVGDGAIEAVLNSIEKMRQACPHTDIRPTLAHNELVAPHQFKRYADLNTSAAISFQWAGFSAAQIEEDNKFLGDERFDYIEPQGRFIDAGARVAFNSDWPIDPLNQWYNFQVALTRQALIGEEEYSPRLDTDRNLTIHEVLSAATLHGAYTLGKDQTIGSLVCGKFADIIVLDRNVCTIPAQEVSKTKVLLTIVGGEIAYHSDKR